MKGRSIQDNIVNFQVVDRFMEAFKEELGIIKGLDAILYWIRRCHEDVLDTIFLEGLCKVFHSLLQVSLVGYE